MTFTMGHSVDFGLSLGNLEKLLHEPVKDIAFKIVKFTITGMMKLSHAQDRHPPAAALGPSIKAILWEHVLTIL